VQQQVTTMRKLVSVLAIFAVAWSTGPWSHAALAATAADPNQARIEELQHQVDALDQELNRLKSASDPAAEQRGMQRHWSMMQDHMRTVRTMPGMQAQGCRDWMMMDPSTMGPGMMERGMMGKGMMDCPMMGHGMGQGGMWGVPANMKPGQYHSQMQGHMTRMHSQMAAIAAEKDPTKRETLLREHYEGMYRDMQTMRGMGWMWTPNAAASLPDRDSQGARLVATICSQCHSPPSPSLHTRAEWAGVTARMRQHMQDQNSAAGDSVKLPNAAELDDITQYLEGHAAAR
jgi:hypothetical protein